MTTLFWSPLCEGGKRVKRAGGFLVPVVSVIPGLTRDPGSCGSRHRERSETERGDLFSLSSENLIQDLPLLCLLSPEWVPACRNDRSLFCDFPFFLLFFRREEDLIFGLFYLSSQKSISYFLFSCKFFIFFYNLSVFILFSHIYRIWISKNNSYLCSC